MKQDRKARSLSPIENIYTRRIAMTKRKNQLFKQAVELSTMCKLDVFICIFDRDMQKIYEFNSEEDFNS